MEQQSAGALTKSAATGSAAGATTALGVTAFALLGAAGSTTGSTATALGVTAFALLGAAGSTTGSTTTALGVFDFVCAAGVAAFTAAFDFFGFIGLGGAIATRFAIRIVTHCLFSIFDFGFAFAEC